jgi:hypothetical protein
MSRVKKEKNKQLRLQPLVGIDLCACGPLNHLKCSGKCRKKHTNEHGEVICGEKYKIEIRTKHTKKRKNRDNTDNVSKRDPKSKRFKKFRRDGE